MGEGGINDHSETHTMAGVLAKLVDLLKGRSFVEILLALILTAIGVGAYWIGNTVMPNQTRQIQEGYERINKENADRNTERMKYQEDSHRKTFEAAAEAFKAAADQNSRRDELLLKALLEKREQDKE